MRICVMIEGQEGPMWEDWLEIAITCEATGIEALFRSDHYAPITGPSDSPALDAWATVAGLAAATNKLRLGVLVSPATFRHPSVLAKTALTCDHISGGRIEVGMGAGWYRTEHDRFGFEFPDPAVRMKMVDEQIQIVKHIWAGQSFDFDGDYYRLKNCVSGPRPLQDPHPVLIVGGRGGRRSMDLAARYADEYNIVFSGPEESRRQRQMLDRACETADRDPSTLPMSLMTGCVIAETRKEVSKKASAVAERQGIGDARALFEAVGETWVIGTIDEAVDRLAALEDAGVSRVMLQHLLFDDVESIELLGQVVGPRTRAGA